MSSMATEIYEMSAFAELARPANVSMSKWQQCYQAGATHISGDTVNVAVGSVRGHLIRVRRSSIKLAGNGTFDRYVEEPTQNYAPITSVVAAKQVNEHFVRVTLEDGTSFAMELDVFDAALA